MLPGGRKPGNNEGNAVGAGLGGAGLGAKIKSYIFDLDGTLLDSMGVWTEIDVRFLSKRGILVPPDYQQSIMPMSPYESACYTIERFNLTDSPGDLLREWDDMAAYAYAHTVAIKPYAKEYLLALSTRGADMAVATSLTASLYEPALNNNGIGGLFRAVCSTAEVACGKTRPDVFLLAARRLGAAPADCIVFEDVLAAVRSAKSAGMTVYGIYDKTSDGDWGQIVAAADGAFMDFRGAPLP